MIKYKTKQHTNHRKSHATGQVEKQTKQFKKKKLINYTNTFLDCTEKKTKKTLLKIFPYFFS